MARNLRAEIGRQSWSPDEVGEEVWVGMQTAQEFETEYRRSTDAYTTLCMPDTVKVIVTKWLKTNLTRVCNNFLDVEQQHRFYYKRTGFSFIEFRHSDLPRSLSGGFFERDDEVAVLLPLERWTLDNGSFLMNTVDLGDDISFDGNLPLKFPATKSSTSRQIRCIMIRLQRTERNL